MKEVCNRGNRAWRLILWSVLPLIPVTIFSNIQMSSYEWDQRIVPMLVAIAIIGVACAIATWRELSIVLPSLSGRRTLFDMIAVSCGACYLAAFALTTVWVVHRIVKNWSYFIAAWIQP
jgi:hypothetical protein